MKKDTNLTEHKCIEYHSILYICSMFPSFIIQVQNTLAPEVEHKENTYLIESLQLNEKAMEVYYSPTMILKGSNKIITSD